jgi:hypothetical protein
MSWVIYFAPDQNTPPQDTAHFEHKADADLVLRIAARRPLDSTLIDEHMQLHGSLYKFKSPAYLFEPAAEWLDMFQSQIDALRDALEQSHGRAKTTLTQDANTNVRAGE